MFLQVHYYQPGFTLVGAGIKNLQAMYKPLPSILPHNITWIHDRAEGFCPSENLVVTWKGDKIYYEFMVIAVGIRNDYDKVRSRWVTDRKCDICAFKEPRNF